MPAKGGLQQDPEKGGAAGRDDQVGEENDDDALMQRVADGDARAYSIIVAASLERVLALARRMLGNDAEAEDVAQEAFLRLWRHADRWQPGRARISTWLYRVTSNLVIDRHRSVRPTTMPELPEIPVSAVQGREMEEEDLSRHVDRALQDLPERQRMALTLFHFEELPMAEVAEMMDASVEAVESLLARGRRALKKSLAESWQDYLPEDLN